MSKQISSVDWLENEFQEMCKDFGGLHTDFIERFEQAKAMEKEQSHKYAEFAIRCDRKDMKILNFEDWIKLETKSE